VLFAAEVPADIFQKTGETGRKSHKSLPRSFLRIIRVIYPQVIFLRFLKSSGNSYPRRY